MIEENCLFVSVAMCVPCVLVGALEESFKGMIMRIFQRSARAIVMLIVLATGMAGCGLFDAFQGTLEGEPDPDAGIDVGVLDAGDHEEENACGGDTELLLDGEFAEPGDACGPCANGVVVCDGVEELRCVAEQVANECGGCEPLPGRVGDGCGPCKAGEYQCDGQGGMECVGADDYNDCGGCNELDGTPNWECDTEDGFKGVWGCTGPEDVRCVPPGENPCGGHETLSEQPGTSCGSCDGGTWACDGPDDVVCENDDAGQNVCGGCEPLFGVLGQACGVCDGQWVCDGENAVMCDQSELNACGGCEELGDANPGQPCAEDVVYVCENPNTLVCPETHSPEEGEDPQPMNACGGVEQLDDEPGDVCGPCEDGIYICASPDATACSGASERNTCGGCEELHSEPGVVCEEGKIWTCDGENDVVCKIDDGVAPMAPGGVSATDGDSSDYVEVTWEGVPNAEEYRVYRDEHELVAVVDDTGDEDYVIEDHGATPGPSPEAPEIENIDAQPTHVRIEFSEPDVDDGPTHVYTVIAANSVGDSDPSDKAQGYRSAGKITDYEIRIDSDKEEDFDEISNFDDLYHEDTTADAPTLSVDAESAEASQGSHVEYVALEVEEALIDDGEESIYEVRALNDTGAGETSTPESGRRIASEPTYQWQHSPDPAEVEFQTLGGQDTSTPTHQDDAQAPEDGAPHYYRVVVGGAGAGEQVSEAVVGYVEAVGQLQVEIEGLPDDSFADVELSDGDANVVANVTETEILELPAGEYSLDASSVISDNLLFEPYDVPKVVAVEPGGLTEVTVTYLLTSGELEITVLGLDIEGQQPADPEIYVEKDSGEVVAVIDEYEQLDGTLYRIEELEPGSYLIRAKSTEQGPADFEANNYAVELESGTTSAETVEYQVVYGSLQLEATGLDDSLEAMASIEGPGAYSLEGSDGEELTDLVPGGYVVEFLSVEDDDKIWGPTEEAEAVAVTVYSQTRDEPQTIATGEYELVPGQIEIQISGELGTNDADIEVSGPDDFHTVITEETTLLDRVPGIYEVEVNSVEDGSQIYQGSGSSTLTLGSDETAVVEAYYEPVECDENGEPFGGGSGDSDDPYRICTPEQLNTIGAGSDYLDDAFVVTSDIDMGNKDYNVIGDFGDRFSGEFDGGNRVISNLTIDRPTENYQGLFGDISGGAVIENITLEQVDITGALHTGGVAGSNRGTVSNCQINGEIAGYRRVGGAIGSNLGGSVENCAADIEVSGDDERIGGLVGYSTGSTVNSETSGVVSGDGEGVGGLIGEQHSVGQTIESFSVAEVTGKEPRVGGLIGDNDGDIKNSYATGAVSGYSHRVGGLTGENGGEIVDSYAEGTVRGEQRVGGLVGALWRGTIVDSYATGDVYGEDHGGSMAGRTVGGLAGSAGGDEAGIYGSYAEGSVTALDTRGGGLVGSNTVEIRDSYAVGDVTARATAGGLTGFNSSVITDSYATGNVEVEDFYGGGLSGDNNNGGMIKNSYATGNIHSEGGTTLGGLVGRNSSQGEINTSYATGNITGDGNNRGGLAGSNIGDIENSYATGNVNGNRRVGGVVGDNSDNASGSHVGMITNSYSTGMATGSSNVGGLVGRLDAGFIIDSYWDEETSGIDMDDDDSGAGEPLTTAEFDSEDTFEEWDFDEIWLIGIASDGEERPVHDWSHGCDDDGDCSTGSCEDGVCQQQRRYVYSGSNDEEVHEIDPDGQKSDVYTVHNGDVRGVAVDPDGYIYSGSQDNELHKHNPDGGIDWTFTFESAVQDVAVSADGYVYAATRSDGVAKLDADGNEVWTHNSGQTWTVAVDTDGYVYIGVSSISTPLRKIDPEGELVWSYGDHDDWVYGVAVDSDGYVYSASRDNELHRVNPDGATVWEYTEHTASVMAVAVDADGYVYSGSADEGLHKINPDGENIWIYEGHSGQVRGVAVGVEGEVFTASRDGEVHKVDSGGQNVWTYTEHNDDVVSIDVEPGIYGAFPEQW